MSEKTMGWTELGDDVPGLDNEDDREKWANFLKLQDVDDEWATAIIAHDENGNMVARFRYSDGTEEIFDLLIRRQFGAVIPIPAAETN